MSISGIGGINPLTPSMFDRTVGGTGGEESVGKVFGDFLKDALNKVNDMQLAAEQATNDFAAGRTDNIHQVMIASEKADIALQFTMQIRNKLLDAYNEIMRIQI